jgi:hypothetical protein
MHAVLLTLLTLGGGVDAYPSGRITQSSAEIYHVGDSTGEIQGATMSYVSGDCATGNCGGGACGGRHGHYHDGILGSWGGHMPQTCYDPRYGCYSGNARYVHRYPAFHGTFYRRAYSYRNYFDYPWHAEMHEPTSLFSYNVVNEASSTGLEEVNSAPSTPSYDEARRTFTPAPNAPYAANRQGQSTLRGAVPAGAFQRDLTDPGATPASTLRR